jgi:isochorismate synthase
MTVMERPNKGANIQQGMAIYRKPQATLPEFSVGNWCSSPTNVAFSANTFCLQPFDRSFDLEILQAAQCGEGWEDSNQIWLQYGTQLSAEPPPMSTPASEFVSEVLGIQQAIASHQIEKAVAARSMSVSQPMDLNRIWHSFIQLHEAYPAAFVFVLIHPHWGCWMGASPETLLRAENGEATVMSLAGTLTQDQDGWTSKEALEQSVTSTFIREVLAAQEIHDAVESNVGELQMGNIKHLMSEWRFKLPLPSASIQPNDVFEVVRNPLMSLIAQLHPTPAVGGYPQAEALNWLRNNERLSRSLYSGFVGVMGSQNANLFVTLRCAQLFQSGYTLYAGCGVNAGSDPNIEWKETAAKMALVGQYL